MVTNSHVNNSLCLSQMTFLKMASSPWLMPVILVTQEAEIRRIAVWSQPGEIVWETLSKKKKKKKPSPKKGWCSGSRRRLWVQTPVPQKNKWTIKKINAHECHFDMKAHVYILVLQRLSGEHEIVGKLQKHVPDTPPSKHISQPCPIWVWLVQLRCLLSQCLSWLFLSLAESEECSSPVASVGLWMTPGMLVPTSGQESKSQQCH
jgi:hypothetical protein